MIELRRFVLVDWYLFRAEQIEVRGMIALIGPNGAGKTAIIDAGQTALSGASMTSIRFNPSAQARGQSKRSIRDYCLGVVSLDKNNMERSAPTREHAYTYVVLGFTDTDTGESINVGVAFSAAADRTEEVLEALFLVRGDLISRNDLLEPVGGGVFETRQWPAVRTLLAARGQQVNDGFGSASEFVEEVLHALSPSGYPLDSRRFLRAFRNALVLKPVDNPTEFVRNYVLDIPPIQVERLRKSLDLYRSITEKIAELKRRSAHLSFVLRAADRILENQRAIRFVEWQVARLEWEAFRKEFRRLDGELDALRAKVNGKHAEATKLAAAAARIDADLASIELTLNSSDAAQLARAGEAERTNARNSRAAKMLEASAIDQALRKTIEVAERKVLAHDGALQKLLSAAAAVRARADLPAWAAAMPETWEAAASAVDAALAEIARGDLAAARDAVASRSLTAEIEVRKVQDRIQAIGENLQRLDQGLSPIEFGTRALISALAAQKIAAKPLCDLVEVADERWRSAAEAVLGASREALVVDPRHAVRAASIYRAGREDEFEQAEVINTTKTQSTRPAQDGSLATVILTDDPHARAFLDFRLGRLMMVETSEALMREDSAVTPDRMLQASRTAKRLRAPRVTKLGRAAIDGARRTLLEERSRLEAELAEKAQAARRLRQDLDLVDGMLRAFREIGTGACAAVGCELAELDGVIAQLGVDIERAKARQDPKLLSEKEKLNRDRVPAAAAKAKAEKALQQLQDEEKKLRWQHEQLIEKDLPRLRDARRAAAQALGADAVARESVSEFERLARYHVAELLPGQIDQRRQAKKARIERAPALASALTAVLSKHCEEYRVALPFSSEEAAPTVVAAWASPEKERLDGHVLVDYEEQCRTAQSEMTTAFQDDLLHRLYDSFEGISETLAELNRHLKDRKFHNRDSIPSSASRPRATPI
jgi:chromosome segregation ATPase